MAAKVLCVHTRGNVCKGKQGGKTVYPSAYVVTAGVVFIPAC
jgi:hypothetical protein